MNPTSLTVMTDSPVRFFTASQDRMPAFLARFQSDRDSLNRVYTAPYSLRRRERLFSFHAEWEAATEALPFETMSRDDQIDWLLLRHHLREVRQELAREAQQFVEMESLLPFAADLIALEDARRCRQDVDPVVAAQTLDRAHTQLQAARERLASGQAQKDSLRTLAYRAVKALGQLREMLKAWFHFSFGYDPLFSWWTEQPYNTLEQAMQSYTTFLQNEVIGGEEALVGDPLGRDSLLHEIANALIPYSPEELIAIAEQERKWCLTELQRAAQEMGLGDDWQAAIERTKQAYVAPGEQVRLVRELVEEAIVYVTERDLLTVPALAREAWRMGMLSPEQQKTSPFFLGGEEILISFPTHTMTHTQKQMSLRGNNRYFARATVQHEMIPGHSMQFFCMERYRPYRQMFMTPFWIEGWTLHWEMLLWELGFPRTPEERVGMLFWRLHRCARVIFSLKFHLRQMSPDACVEMLVHEVGHERNNAIAEVRRSFSGEYPPLYQCAYLLGGLQVHALHRELLASGWSQRRFHDTFLQANVMPIAALRALLSDVPLTREGSALRNWNFYRIDES